MPTSNENLLHPMSEHFLAWHIAATHNKTRLEQAGGGVCSACKTHLDIDELDWIDDTAQCPECGVDCIIPITLLVGVPEEALEAFRVHWHTPGDELLS